MSLNAHRQRQQPGRKSGHQVLGRWPGAVGARALAGVRQPSATQVPHSLTQRGRHPGRSHPISDNRSKRDANSMVAEGKKVSVLLTLKDTGSPRPLRGARATSHPRPRRFLGVLPCRSGTGPQAAQEQSLLPAPRPPAGVGCERIPHLRLPPAVLPLGAARRGRSHFRGVCKGADGTDGNADSAAICTQS